MMNKTDWWEREEYFTYVEGVASFKIYNIEKIVLEAQRLAREDVLKEMLMVLGINNPKSVIDRYRKFEIDSRL